MPQISSSTDPLIQQGSKYYYLLPNSDSWTASAYSIQDSRSLLGNTMQVIWNQEKNQDISHFLYNDQPPSLPAIVMNGHTKGLIITSSQSGLWLQHSCPHFPDPAAQNFSASYPTGGLINGQLFLCMSLENPAIVDTIGIMLQYTKPFVYNYSIPNRLKSLLPQLTKVAEENATIKNAPWFHTFEMNTTMDQLQLKVFAKGPKFRKDIYSAWIAPEYESSLDVQSWLNGQHPLGSNCTSSICPVYNVLIKNQAGQNFSYTDDHSKWAVSLKPEKPLTCIGDLNRMKPQKSRGGVAICMVNEHIWSAFKTLVEEIQPCNSTIRTKRKFKNWA